MASDPDVDGIGYTKAAFTAVGANAPAATTLAVPAPKPKKKKKESATKLKDAATEVVNSIQKPVKKISLTSLLRDISSSADDEKISDQLSQLSDEELRVLCEELDKSIAAAEKRRARAQQAQQLIQDPKLAAKKKLRSLIEEVQKKAAAVADAKKDKPDDKKVITFKPAAGQPGQNPANGPYSEEFQKLFDKFIADHAQARENGLQHFGLDEFKEIAVHWVGSSKQWVEKGGLTHIEHTKDGFLAHYEGCAPMVVSKDKVIFSDTNNIFGMRAGMQQWRERGIIIRNDNPEIPINLEFLVRALAVADAENIVVTNRAELQLMLKPEQEQQVKALADQYGKDFAAADAALLSATAPSQSAQPQAVGEPQPNEPQVRFRAAPRVDPAERLRA